MRVRVVVGIRRGVSSNLKWTATNRRLKSRSACAMANGTCFFCSASFQKVPGNVAGVELTAFFARRMVATFNHTHTVGDIRQYIDRCV